ncbi:MAG: IS3 family transposase [Proteobacteria bacterium]|nr:IS3 family transposase [Pseudomonadota bacterium]
MKEFRSEFSVKKMARVLEVSRSGYYEWDGRLPSPRALTKLRLKAEVRAVFEANGAIYGSLKVTEGLEKRGITCRRHRVANLMREQGLRSKVKRKYRVTTDSRHSYPVAPNILNREFTTNSPNRVWTSDITYLSSRSGWLYLVFFMDLYSRMIVGWCVSKSLGHEMVLSAFSRAVGRRRPPEGLLIHSDRGVQYCCDGFRAVVSQHKFVQSMSRKGNCWDNAVSESFIRSLKTELIYHINLIDVDHAQQVLFGYIESFYNAQRLHATLGYVTPVEYEAQHLAKCA